MFITKLVSFTLIFIVAQACQGPRTSTELANTLWGAASNYSQTLLDRPNVAQQSVDSTVKNPTAVAKPDEVELQMNLLSIKELDQKKGEFEVMMWLRQRWNDYRLRYQTESSGGCLSDGVRHSFDEKHLKNIWQPQVVPINLVKSEDKMTGSFWVHSNGDIDLAQSVTMRLSCEFDFTEFPIDTQLCKAVMGTWKEDASEVRLRFRDDMPPITQVNPGESFSENLEWKLVSTSSKTGVSEGEPYLTFSFQLERESSYYMHFVIGPVLCMVTISWASFFVDRGAVPARVTLTIISFLTVTNFLGTQLAVLPRLGGNDVWLLQFMIMSIIFTFLSVIEYVLVNYLFRVEKRLTIKQKAIYEAKKKKEELAKQNPYAFEDEPKINFHNSCKTIAVTKEDLVNHGAFRIDRLLLRKNGTMYFKDQHVDIFFRIFFPISYGIAFFVLWGIHA